MSTHARRRILLAAVSAAVLLGLLAVWKAPDWKRRMRLAAIERRGDLAFQNGDLELSERCWQQVLGTNPRSAGALNKLAVLRMNACQYTKAKRLLEEGVRRIPGEASFRYNLGLLCYMEGSLDEALAHLDEVERMNPGHGHVHFLKGMIWTRLGKAEAAKKEFIRQLNVDPATPAAWAQVTDVSPEPRLPLNRKLLGTSP